MRLPGLIPEKLPPRLGLRPQGAGHRAPRWPLCSAQAPRSSGARFSPQRAGPPFAHQPPTHAWRLLPAAALCSCDFPEAPRSQARGRAQAVPGGWLSRAGRRSPACPLSDFGMQMPTWSLGTQLGLGVAFFKRYSSGLGPVSTTTHLRLPWWVLDGLDSLQLPVTPGQETWLWSDGG